MNTIKQENLVVERLLSVISEVQGRLQEVNPTNVISLLRSRVVSILSTLQNYDLLDSILLLGFVRTTYDEYFERKIRILAGEELEKGSILPSIVSGLKREFQWLSVDEHFDSDYILEFDKLEGELTTLPQIKKILTEEEYRKVQSEILTSVGTATDAILTELRQFDQDFLQNTERELSKKRTIEAFEASLRNLVREMHTRVLGWP